MQRMRTLYKLGAILAGKCRHSNERCFDECASSRLEEKRIFLEMKIEFCIRYSTQNRQLYISQKSLVKMKQMQIEILNPQKSGLKDFNIVFETNENKQKEAALTKTKMDNIKTRLSGNSSMIFRGC